MGLSEDSEVNWELSRLTGAQMVLSAEKHSWYGKASQR